MGGRISSAVRSPAAAISPVIMGAVHGAGSYGCVWRYVGSASAGDAIEKPVPWALSARAPGKQAGQAASLRHAMRGLEGPFVPIRPISGGPVGAGDASPSPKLEDRGVRAVLIPQILLRPGLIPAEGEQPPKLVQWD